MSTISSSTVVNEPATKKQRREEARALYESTTATASTTAASVASSSSSSSEVASSNSAWAPTIFMSGLPPLVIGLRKQLKERLSSAGYEVKSCRVIVNSFNHPRAYGYLTLKDQHNADRLFKQQHQVFRFDGAPPGHPALSFSPVMGKLDILFPFIPTAIRSQIELDSTALFSVTDQEHAQRITQLILCMLSIGARDPNTVLKNTLTVTTKSSNGTTRRWDAEQVLKERENSNKQQQSSLPSSNSSDNMSMLTDEQERAQQIEEAKADAAEAREIELQNEQQAEQDQQQQQQSETGAVGPSGRIYSADAEINRIATDILENSNWSTWTDLEGSTSTLSASTSTSSAAASASLKIASSPYSITDGCACSGGNALNFGRYFAQTHAIEFDENRCRDLRQNVSLFRMQSKVNVYQGDSFTQICKIAAANTPQHVLYLDPPYVSLSHASTQIHI